MRKPVVDYRTFRLNRIHEPEFAHLKLLLGWVVYVVLFVLTENLIPPEDCYPVHCFLDDLIPFCEIFLIPYVFWYFLIALSLLFFLLYKLRPDHHRYMYNFQQKSLMKRLLRWKLRIP